jgi:N-acetylmuramoyl-L-alanine amidase
MKFLIKILFCFLIFFKILFCFSETTWKFSTPSSEFEICFVPKIIEGNFYIPIKELLTKFNAEIFWYGKEKKLEFYVFNKRVSIQIENKNFLIQGEEKTLSSPPLLIEGNIFLSLKAISEILDFKYYVSMKDRYIKFISFINKVEILKEEKFQIKIISTIPTKYKLEKLQFPDRIVVDFPESILNLEEKFYKIEEGAIRNLRISQFTTNPYVVRFVIDLDVPLNFKIFQKENETILEFNKQIKEITYEVEEEKVKIKIRGTSPLSYIPAEYRNPWRLVFDFSECILGIKEKEIKIEKGIVEKIRMSQFQIQPEIVRIVIDLQTRSSFKIYPVEENREILIELSTLIPSLNNKIIVVDPGHGGRQNGAISPWGIKEKELNLEIAKNLYELLILNGCLVIMTRTEDVEISLEERVAIANLNKADIFVSIHNNSLPANPKIKGTETYYYTYFSKPLAIAIQKNLTEETGLVNRGVKTAGFVVIKKTNIPAVLVEVGYLTNKEDEEKLRDSEFKKKVALGIFRGIKEYFENEELIPVE